jgi:DNA polymerase-3 subunit epsilon
MAGDFRWIGQSLDGQTVTLKRFAGQFKTVEYATEEWLAAHPERIRSGIVIDVETTGLNKKTDSVIEVGLRTFLFNKLTGELLKAGTTYSGLQDPGKPLSDEIKRLTGLNDEMLAGKNIDWKHVNDLIEKAHVLIAHNASFDRPFIDRHSSASTTKPWACSYKQVEWTRKGFSVHKLDVLCIYHGFFTDAHRALNDVDALLNLLSMNDTSTNRSYLNELLTNARKPVTRVVAASSPFETKDLLKERGYSWDATGRAWQKVINKNDLASEVAWLESAVYLGDFKGRVEDITLTDQFK